MKKKIIKAVSIIGTLILLLSLILFFLPDFSSDTSPLLVLQVTLQQTSDYQVSLKNIEVQRGYPSDYKLDMQNQYYSFKILDGNDRELFSGKVPNGNIIFPNENSESAYVIGNSASESQELKISPLEVITLNLPYYKTAKKIVLYSQTDQLIYEIKIDQSKLSIPHISENLCGNGMCDTNENIVRCFSDCKYQIGEFEDTLIKRLVP